MFRTRSSSQAGQLTATAASAWEPGPATALKIKRTIDIVGAAILLLAACPVLVIVVIAIKLDSPGPVLFRQQRLGKQRQSFTMLKFRSMYRDVSTEAHRNYIATLAQAKSADGLGELRKLTDDSRVTTAGRLLRRTSLDELPQLLNVLLGHMSLIGPRPAIDYELEHYRQRDFDRFLVRPGLTGLWQVSGRARLGFHEMLSLDAEYALTCSLPGDLKILLMTPAAVISKLTA